MSSYLWIWLVLINLVAFLAFGLDKHRARQGWRRTREIHLVLLVFLGGIPGGWGGMQVFRHKTRKRSFQGMMLLATLFNPLWLLLGVGPH